MTIKQLAFQFVKSGKFPNTINSMPMTEAKAFWAYVRKLEA